MFIGLFFIFLSSYIYFQHVIMYSDATLLVSIVFIHTAFVGYLIGPMIYFYVRNSLSDSYSFRKTDFIHFIPALIFIIASHKYYLTSWDTKTEIAEQIINDRAMFWHLSRTYIGWLIPNSINFLSRPALLFAYVFVSLVNLIRFRKQGTENKIMSNSKMNFKWLITLFIFIMLLSLAQAIMVIISIQDRNIQAYYSLNIMQVLSGTALIGIIVLPFFFPSVLYGMAKFSIPPGISGRIENKTENKESPGKLPGHNNIDNKTNGFDKNYLTYIETVTEACMKKERPYLQKDCNIIFFAKILNIPAHHLSYYFREVKRQSFNDFRNEWRIRHAKSLMLDNKNREYTIEAIGMQAGFLSKNAFFSAFKKFENTTPRKYALLILKTSPDFRKQD